MRIRCALTSACAVALATVATAQLPGPGLNWTGTLGGATGSYLPSCANLPVAAVRGETVTLRVSGDMMAFYILAAAGSGTQCLPFPGLGNALVLDPPVFLIGAGLLTQVTPCLSCPPGFQDVVFVIPAGVPTGASIAFQALSSGASNPAFTVAITATVR
jgi:hypothetical protein